MGTRTAVGISRAEQLLQHLTCSVEGPRSRSPQPAASPLARADPTLSSTRSSMRIRSQKGSTWTLQSPAASPSIRSHYQSQSDLHLCNLPGSTGTGMGSTLAYRSTGLGNSTAWRAVARMTPSTALS